MPSIRYRHNYRAVVLCGSDDSKGKGISGDQIPAVLRDGTYRYFKFGGFLSLDFVKANQTQQVKLPNIDGFSKHDHGLSDMVYIPHNLLLGAYVDNNLFVVLSNDFPVKLLYGNQSSDFNPSIVDSNAPS